MTPTPDPLHEALLRIFDLAEDRPDIRAVVTAAFAAVHLPAGENLSRCGVPVGDVCVECAAAQPAPPLDVLRCVKCGGTDISTRWDATHYDCTWSSRRDPGNQGEHLHRHCRTCSYGWGEPVAALSEPKP